MPAKRSDIDPIQRTILRFIWGNTSEQKTGGPIRNADITRPIHLGGLGLLDIKAMRDSLGLYWVQRLELAYEMPECTRPKWFSLICNILLHQASPEIKTMVQKPWAQIWDCRPRRPPVPVDHFLRHWDVRDSCIPPKTLSELAATDFLFHPDLNEGRASVKWAAPV